MADCWGRCASLAISNASLVSAIASVFIAKSSLTQAKLAVEQGSLAVEHARMHWAQRKWFDLYFKADQAYNALDRSQVLYQGSNPAVQSEEQLRDYSQLMHLLRDTMTVVFPKNAATDALFASTQFSNPNDVLSKDRRRQG
jgi:hypothetical protein